MDNFSPLGIAESDERLSRPEAVAPIAVDPALQARQHKLRRVVGWVVGGAVLLMCAGLVRAATRSHSDQAVVSEAAPGPTVQAAVTTAPAPVAAAPDQAAADPSAVQAAAPPATPSAAPTPVAQKPNRKPSAGGVARINKPAAKHPSSVKSPIARNW